jgi:mannitol/fructose-specific phosphotransferase system IIA component (Ntr-type)
MSTGIGEQMAIPHAVIPHADRFMTECAIIKNGIDFESIDGSKAFVVVMLVAPKSALQEHLKVMGSIAKVFYKVETRQRVIAAKTAEEALAVIRDAPA